MPATDRAKVTNEIVVEQLCRSPPDCDDPEVRGVMTHRLSALCTPASRLSESSESSAGRLPPIIEPGGWEEDGACADGSTRAPEIRAIETRALKPPRPVPRTGNTALPGTSRP